MEIRAKYAEEQFAAAYGILPAHAVAFRRRLEHLRSRGCPAGLQTGTGRPATYGWTQLVQLTVALDLLDVGLTPERAARLALSGPLDLHLCANALVLKPDWIDDEAEWWWPEKALEWIDADTWPLDYTLFLLSRLGEISSLAGERSSISDGFHAVEGAKLALWNAERLPTDTIVIALDFGLAISTLIKRISIWKEMPTIEVAASFYDWSQNYVIHS